MLTISQNEPSTESLLSLSSRSVLLISLIAYCAFAQLAMLLNSPDTNGGTFWPGAGLSLGLLLILPTRQWVFVLLGVALGEFVGNAVRGYSPIGNVFWTLGNCLEPLVAAILIRRSGNSNGSLTPIKNMLLFIGLGAVVAPMVGATIGAVGTAEAIGVPYMLSWTKFYVGDALGILVITPVILSRVRFVSLRLWSREQLIYAALLLVLSQLILKNWGPVLDLLLPFLFLPLMLWSSLRFGLRGTALTILSIAYLVTFAIESGYVPYRSAYLPETYGVTMMQLRLLIGSFTALVVASLTNELIRGISNQKRLLVQAHRDELTGLLNRAGLNYRLSNTSQRRGTDRTPHLLICDLDSFKPVNDRHGHLAGDDVLIEVANRLSTCIRDGDAVARIGGDEFVVLLDSSDRATVNAIANRILEQMSAPILGSFGNVEVSVSIGITKWNSDMPIETAMRAADVALYKAKHAGKNRSEWAASSSSDALA